MRGEKKIVITRPLGQSDKFIKQVCDQYPFVLPDGFLIEPMLDIETYNVDVSDVEFDSWIITSSNAIPCVKKNLRSLDKPVYCVGERTAAKVKSLLPEVEIHFYQNAESLLRSIEGHAEGRRFLYIRGEHVSVDMAKSVGQLGGEVHSVVCYSAHTMEEFSPKFIELLKNGEVGAIVFFSKRTAKTFFDLMNRYADLSGQKFVDLIKFDLLSISTPVIECTYTNNDAMKVIVSATPDLKGMVDAVGNYVLDSSE
jgi:uroporphyrinogen-III synthase